MPTRRPPAPQRKRAARKPRTSPISDTPVRDPELSGYELLERRSRELEAERARGGFGTSQSPYDPTPLLYSHADDAPAAKSGGKKAKAAPKTPKKPAPSTRGGRRRKEGTG